MQRSARRRAPSNVHRDLFGQNTPFCVLQNTIPQCLFARQGPQAHH
ncbi:hypothetical protein JDM601_0728 [Mycolicibacter sinensis]|uniref:Uncharacterized protein n=1 Tax=Mycolicibacter sinensis (strain JDM601) TaxID=875328 RepID=F5YRU6_MYCSD|nr:hypothetical protein JDM601_0728 [Mycolicibacter sinensis]